MTDAAPPPDQTDETGRLSIRAAVAGQLARRHRQEQAFRRTGMIAVGFATIMLVVLLGAIGWQSASAFRKHFIRFETLIDPALAAPQGIDNPVAIRENVAGFSAIVKRDLLATFPEADAGPALRRALDDLVTRLAVLPVARKISDHPGRVGTVVKFRLALNDDLDLYLKGRLTEEKRSRLGPLTVSVGESVGVSVIEGDFADVMTRVKAVLAARALAEESRLEEAARHVRDLEQRRAVEGDSAEIQAALATATAEAEALRADIAALRERAGAAASEERFDANSPSLIIEAGGQFVKVETLTASRAEGRVLTGPEALRGLIRAGGTAYLISVPQAQRTVSDRQIAWVRALQDKGRIVPGFNMSLFTHADSTYPEIAGALAAIVGSLFTMLITATLALPIGVAAALYLEEYAPKNRLTGFIEVNINNLAAVPSIVFGLLGAAVFLNFMGLPRSAPLVGGMVLALLTLPTVIIASRAALKAVPPSIREAALGVGASRTQAVFHHVLPLAAPGMMTGAIIGLARALGETAPLLLIGMVAFVAEVPAGPGDEATALPVLIYKWSTGAERAWEPMTAAAIVILLVFLIVMNAAAVILRRRFERRW